MGKLLILSRYIFLIYGSDICEIRKHCTYAYKGFKRSCKFWLEPEVELDENKMGGFTSKELNEIKQLILQHKETILEQLEHFYNNEPVKAIRL